MGGLSFPAISSIKANNVAAHEQVCMLWHVASPARLASSDSELASPTRTFESNRMSMLVARQHLLRKLLQPLSRIMVGLQQGCNELGLCVSPNLRLWFRVRSRAPCTEPVRLRCASRLPALSKRS